MIVHIWGAGGGGGYAASSTISVQYLDSVVVRVGQGGRSGASGCVAPGTGGTGGTGADGGFSGGLGVTTQNGTGLTPFSIVTLVVLPGANAFGGMGNSAAACNSGADGLVYISFSRI